MDEYNRGWDPEVKKYFRKIVYSFVFGFLWMFTFSIAGFYYELAITHGHFRWYNLLYYLLLVVSLAFLLRYLYVAWKERYKGEL